MDRNTFLDFEGNLLEICLLLFYFIFYTKIHYNNTDKSIIRNKFLAIAEWDMLKIQQLYLVNNAIY